VGSDNSLFNKKAPKKIGAFLLIVRFKKLLASSPEMISA
jgi:hypothetical protein